MAGGMGRSNWGTLAERLAQSSPHTPPEPSQDPALKHCWVSGPDGRVPGLLLGWRRDEVDGCWVGRVVRPVRMEGGAWWVVEDWLPADTLSPAG